MTPLRSAGLAGLLGLLLAGGGAGAAAGRTGQDETRALMREIFAQMRLLLPRLVAPGRLDSGDDPAVVQGALHELATNAHALSVHVESRDPGMRHLGDSLARDARDALRAFERGRTETASFLVQELTENCIACHARLRSGDSPLAEAFLAESELRELPLEQRVRLEMATRRFDAALASFEALLASPEHHPAALLGAITDYLTLAVRVKGDYARPRTALERFARRPDLWRHLRLDVEHWIEALRSFAAERGRTPSLGHVRTVLAEGKARIRFPADRRALVHYVVASTELHRLVEITGLTREERAEAYWLLGLVESRIGRNEWVSQSGAFLESAIRLAPGSPIAEEAYAVLEEETLLDHTGSLEGVLPPDVAEHLRELEGLLDGPARAGQAP